MASTARRPYLNAGRQTGATTRNTLDPVTVGVIGYMGVSTLVLWAVYSWYTVVRRIFAIRAVDKHSKRVVSTTLEAAFESTLFILFIRPRMREYVPWLDAPLSFVTALPSIGTTDVHNARLMDAAPLLAPGAVRLWSNGKARIGVSIPGSSCRIVSGRVLFFSTVADAEEFVRVNAASASDAPVPMTPASSGQELSHAAGRAAGRESGGHDDEELVDFADAHRGGESMWLRSSGDYLRDSGDVLFGGVVMHFAALEAAGSDGAPSGVHYATFTLSQDQVEQIALLPAPSPSAAPPMAPLTDVADDNLHALAFVLKVELLRSEAAADDSFTSQVGANEVFTLCYIADCVAHQMVDIHPPPPRDHHPSGGGFHHAAHHRHQRPAEVKSTPLVDAAPAGRQPALARSSFDARVGEDDDDDEFSECHSESRGDGRATPEPHATLVPAGNLLFGFLDVRVRPALLEHGGVNYLLRPVFADDSRHQTPQTTNTIGSRARRTFQAAGRETRSDSDDDLAAGMDHKICIVCYMHRKSVALAPCMHFNLCPQCACKVDHCPECRTDVAARIVVGL